MKRVASLLLAACLLLCLAACVQKVDPASVPGTQEGNVYANAFFGLRCEAPDGWTMKTRPELAALNVAQSDTALKALWAVFTLLPAIGAVLAVLTWRKYDLKTSDVELMARFNNGEIDLESCEAGLSHPYPRTAK